MSKKDSVKQNQPFIVHRGEIVEASYNDPMVSAYRDNLFEEALPPILSTDDSARHMKYYPPYDKDKRDQPSHLRYHEIQNSLRLFSVLSKHLDLEQRVSRVIRGGYVNRQPLSPEFRRKLNKSAEFLSSNENARRRIGTMNTGFTILGISGVGKSRTMLEVLTLYPQVIIHKHYKGRDFNFIQIVWLKLDCPPDGSIRGLCLNFFQTLDAILKTNYHHNYRGCTANELRLHMARIAAEFGIGILVIDEIQNLSVAASGGRAEMLNFFVNLNNALGVPVVLIGTYKAYDILTGEFRQIRRGTGQGDFIWDPMTEDGEDGDWEFFVKDLWKYQYTQKPVELTPDLSHTLYYESQGITDIAAKLYMISQIRAIANRTEIITAKLIQRVAKEDFRSATKVLSALKTGNTEALFQIEDVKPINIEDFIEEVKRNDSSAELLRDTGQLEDSKVEPKQEQKGPVDEQKNSTQVHLCQSITEKKKSKRFTGSNVEKEGLVSTKIEAEKLNVAPYDALSKAGFIQSATEYLPQEKQDDSSLP